MIEHGLKIFNLHSRKSYQIGRILLAKNDKCDYCSEGVYVGMYVLRYIRKVCSYDGLDVTLCMYVDRYVGK